jgi:hypothetical protein
MPVLFKQKSEQLMATLDQFELLTLGGFAYIRCMDDEKYWKIQNKNTLHEIVDSCIQHIKEDHGE